jgi:hypothetical protein
LEAQLLRKHFWISQRWPFGRRHPGGKKLAKVHAFRDLLSLESQHLRTHFWISQRLSFGFRLLNIWQLALQLQLAFLTRPEHW